MNMKWKQRCYAWLLSGVMAITAVPSVSLAAGDAAKLQDTAAKLEAAQNEKAADAQMGGYLWANFGTEGGYEKIFFGYSEDGLTWTKLNKKDGVSQPILVNDAEGSDLGVRDPHIIRSAEGNKYWILGTDLHAEGGGAGGSGWNQLSASQKLVIWESTDLVNWREPRLVDAGFDDAGCVWAPEAIYDEAKGDYAVYWSARDKSKAGTSENALRVYVCRTKDFVTFTEPKVWLSEDVDGTYIDKDGKEQFTEVNIIDSTIVKDKGKYYRFSTSDWNTVIDVSDTLDTEDVLDVKNGEEQSTPKGSWKRLVKRSGSSAAGFDGREGLTVYQLPNGLWCVMGDNQGYKAFLTKDLASGKFTAMDASFPDGKFRHGTVMRLTAEEDARIQEAFGNKDSDDDQGETPIEEPILSYDFEGDEGETTITDSAIGDAVKDDGTLYGKAEVVYDEERKSNVLKLDGSSGAYAEIPQGFFDGRDVMTISMDVKSEKDSGNFFTFAYGKNSTAYDFLRVRGTEVRNAITINGWENEQAVSGLGAGTGKWQKVVLVIKGSNMKLYIDGSLVSENKNTARTSSLGTDLKAYFGKSFYDDPYFKGSFDNFKVYNRALGEEEIAADVMDYAPLLKGAVVGTVPDRLTALISRGTDDHTAVFSDIDLKRKEIVPYVRTGTNLKAVPVSLNLLTKKAHVTADGKDFTGGVLDLSKDVTLEVTLAGRKETYTIKKAKIARNPVLPGQYADPDIDYFDGKFWIYPTTDGYPGWSGTKFHAFSSKDMVNWEDEGVIMELANDNPGLNEKGVQIAKSPWAVKGSAWAPTIEKKNGKYYFYYCGKFLDKDGKEPSAIGVAVADSPAGPYTDLGEPLMTTDMCKAANVSMGQAIDPSIFTDDDGTSYLLFGNGNAAIAKLDDDMMSIADGTLTQINGLKISNVVDFRESVIVTKVDGKYHWTWSDDDANSPNYHVNYGVSDELIGADGTVNVTFKKAHLLSKDESKGILGSAHQSVVHVKDANKKDRYFMAYHRFYTPIGIFTSSDGLGVHRETCIDEIFFDEKGEMVITPTLEGVPAVVMANEDGSVNLTPGVSEQGSGSFEVDIAEFTPDANTAVSIKLPESLADSIKSSDSQKISVNVVIPSTLMANGKMPKALTLPKEVLAAAGESQKELTVTVNGSSSYQWTFSGTSQASDVNLLLEVDSAKDADVKNLLKADEKGMVLSFAQQGAIQGAKVTVNVSKMGWKAGESVTLSYYNPQSKALETVKTYTVSKDGKVTVDVAKGGRYAVWKKNAPNVPVKINVSSIKLNKKSVSVGVQDEFTLKATVKPSNATNRKVTWQSKNKKIATVTQKGMVKGKKIGKVTIIAKADGKSAKCTINVKPAPKKITLNAKSKTLKKKKTFQIKIKKKTPSNSVSNKITYKTSNKKVATVSSTGKVKAIKPGKATITVTTCNKKARATIKITVKK